MFLKSNILESLDINENMNHTTQSHHRIDAGCIDGSRDFYRHLYEAQALTIRASDGESIIMGRDGISVTDEYATLDTGDTHEKATPTDTGNTGDTNASTNIATPSTQ
jgi:hypothetical protein